MSGVAAGWTGLRVFRMPGTLIGEHRPVTRVVGLPVLAAALLFLHPHHLCRSQRTFPLPIPAHAQVGAAGGSWHIPVSTSGLDVS